MAEAIRSHPENVSGTRRDELALHRAIPGLVGKAGAEAVYAVGLPDGTGVAIKISDGSPRARACRDGGDPAVVWVQLAHAGRAGGHPVLGHGDRVGEIRPVAEAFARL